MYISKDRLETAKVTIEKRNGSSIVELEYVHSLDRIAEEYKVEKNKEKKKALKEEYKALALEVNSQYKIPLYNQTLY